MKNSRMLVGVFLAGLLSVFTFSLCLPRTVFAQYSEGFYDTSPSPPPYSQATYYSQSTYYSQGTYGGTYSQSTYYSQGTYGSTYSQSTYYSQGTYGGSCTTGGSPDATCTNGNITNLNFGLNNIFPWFQGFGGDIRLDNGIADRMPAGAYAAEFNTSGFGGIAFTGDQASDLGSGAGLSHAGFVVGGTTNSEVYSPAKAVLRASYTYEQGIVKQNGITPTAFSSCPSTSPCNLSSYSHGIYQDTTDADVYLSNSTFSAGNYIFLIKGNLHFVSTSAAPSFWSTKVQPGATVSFFVQGNISVDTSVGESTLSSTSTDLEGFFSTEKNFILQSKANCPATPDNRLNIGGAIVVNAALTGGTIQNSRTLCNNDGTYPSFTVTERPDMILNAPQLIETQNTQVQEVAP